MFCEGAGEYVKNIMEHAYKIRNRAHSDTFNDKKSSGLWMDLSNKRFAYETTVDVYYKFNAHQCMGYGLRANEMRTRNM